MNSPLTGCALSFPQAFQRWLLQPHPVSAPRLAVQGAQDSRAACQNIVRVPSGSRERERERKDMLACKNFTLGVGIISGRKRDERESRQQEQGTAHMPAHSCHTYSRSWPPHTLCQYRTHRIKFRG
eukprot:170714-Rhodomonas_salina.4